MRRILLALALFMSAIGMYAQTNDGFSFAVKGGFNLASMTNVTGHSFNPGYSVGVTGKYMFAENMGVESGLFYSVLGCKSAFEDPLSGSHKEEKYTPTYVQMPILFVYQFYLGEKSFIYPTIGPYVGYGIMGKGHDGANFFGTGANSVQVFNTGQDDGLSNLSDALKFDAGVSVGLNLQINNFLMGINYQRSLAPVNKIAFPNTVYNQVVQVSMGYNFYSF